MKDSLQKRTVMEIKVLVPDLFWFIWLHPMQMVGIPLFPEQAAKQKHLL